MNIRENIEMSKNDLAMLISGNNIESYNELISVFNAQVTVRWDEQIDNRNFAAQSGGRVRHKFNENGELLVQSSNITVDLQAPPNSDSPGFNGWMVDIHHELFHAYTRLMSGIKKCEKKENKYYAPSGGKISILEYNNNSFTNRR